MTWIKRRKWFLIVTAVLAGLVVFVGPRVMAPILRSRLKTMVESRLNAELDVGSLTYRFPYGIVADDVSLVATADDGERVVLCKAGRVELALAELPIGQGPLVIEKLIFTRPEVHLVRTDEGIIGEWGLIKKKTSKAAKLSEMFRLRRFKIDGGQIVYDDRTLPDNLPMVWKNLQIDLNTNPTSGAIYSYNLVANNLPWVEAAAAGTMDIDELLLDVRNFAVKLHVDPDANQSQLPGKIQEVLRRHQIEGQLRLEGKARVPLTLPADSTYDAIVDLSRASGALPQWGASLDRMVLKLHVSSDPGADEPKNVADADTSAATGPDAKPGSSGVIAAKVELKPDAPPAPKASPQSAPMPAGTAVAADPVASKVAPATRPVAPPLCLRIELLEAGSGDSMLRIEKGTAQLSSVEGKWRVRQLAGVLTVGSDRSALPTPLRKLLDGLGARGRLDFTARASGPIRPTPGRRAVDEIDYELLALPRGLTIQPPTFPLPLEKITGSLHLQNSLVRVQNMQASYGEDRIDVADCKLPLGNVAREISLEGLDGAWSFGLHAPPYPPVLGKIFDLLHPMGTFLVSGRCAILRDEIPNAAPTDGAAENGRETRVDYRFDYRLDVGCDHGVLAPGPQRIPLTDVKLDLSLASGVGEVRQFEAVSCGGRITGTGQLRTGKVFAYQGKINVAKLDLKQLAEAWAATTGDKPPRLSGHGYLNALFSGTEPRGERTAADNFRAKGDFEVVDGNFWAAPVVKDVVDGMKVRDALTAGQAAATFEIFDRKVVMDKAAISAPVLGLQGAGEVRFDGQVDGRVVAAPLGDWRDKLKQAKVPLLSDAAGAVQKLLNSASGTLLYEFRVTGTVAHPSISTIPAPILTDSAAGLFGAMLNQKKEERLIQVLRRDITQQAPVQKDPTGELKATAPPLVGTTKTAATRPAR